MKKTVLQIYKKIKKYSLYLWLALAAAILIFILLFIVLKGCGKKAEPPLSEAPTASEEKTDFPSSYTISDFPFLIQTPELPTGCEITSLTMVLNYYGFDADKMTMALDYLPTVEADMYYDDEGILHGANPNDYFIGDPQSPYGYICGTGAIIKAADGYLADSNSSMTAKDVSGYSPEELYKLTAEDTPVVVWITIDMASRSTTEGWYTDGGDYVEWSQSDHAGVLVGYTQDSVIIADPLYGETQYSRSDFESAYASRGSRGVIIINN